MTMKYAKTYHTLAKFGRELLEKKSLAEALPLISKYTKDVIGAQRCSIFIYDTLAREFWTTLADGVEKITIDADKGLVGFTLQEKKPIIANDPYTHPHFLGTVDKETGFKTENVITAPIFSSKREILGVLQLLNKEGGFDNEDVRFMIFFAHYISGYLELTNVYLSNNREYKDNR